MKSTTRKVNNVYWSFRRYIHSQLNASYTIYWNPIAQPQPDTVDQWIIYESGSYDPGLITHVTPRIHCVSRNDTEGIDIESLVDAVVNIFDRQTTSRFIDFYDKTSATKIGEIEIISAVVGNAAPYSTGIQSKSVNITARLKTARNK